MKIHSKGQLIVMCEKCKKNQTFNSDDFCWEVVESQERSMGAEITHEAANTFNCSYCENEIDIKIELYEYPEGSINFGPEYTINGAKLESKLEIE